MKINLELDYKELVALIDNINPPRAVNPAQFFELQTLRDKALEEYQKIERRI